MKIVINLLLAAAIFFLMFVLYSIIKEPISFQEAKTARKNAVVDKLKEIRTAQEIYRSVTGEFASNFDTLNEVLKTGQIEFIALEDDPDSDDPDVFIKTVSYKNAIDSIRALDINLDSLRYVPMASKGTEFTIAADTMTYQKTLVNVVEVGTLWKTFMGPYADAKYSKYDNSYDPNKVLKFGNMNAPNVTGNWEK
jgi:hypothetical protein